MSLQNTNFTIQVGRRANISLGNAMIYTGEEGVTIQFGSVDFPSIVTQNTTAPTSTALAQGQVRRARGYEIPKTVVEVPRKRISVFERLSAPKAPTLKRRVIGLMPVSTLATLPTKPFAPGRHDVKVFSSGAKLSRRQRRKRNAKLRAQQLLSELPATQIQQTPGETSNPAREENIHISKNVGNNFNNTSVSKADTMIGDVSAMRDSNPWGSPPSQSLKVSRVGSLMLREDSNVPISESMLPNTVTTAGPLRSKLQETVVLDILGHVEEYDLFPVSDLYESQIRSRAISNEDPLAWQYREISLHFLRDVILHLDPQVPSTYHDFVEKANHVLDVVARFGIKEEVLRFWEGACRQVEFLIEKFKTFNWVCFSASLPELQRRVEHCGAATNLARDDLNKSIETANRQQNTWVNTSTEFENYTSKLKKLWKEVTTLLSCRAKVQETLRDNMRDIIKGQQSRQLRQQTFEVAEAAFIRAEEEWKIAQAEQPSFLRVTSRLDHLKARLAEI